MGHITLLDLHSLLIVFYICLLSNFIVRIHQLAFIPSFDKASFLLFKRQLLLSVWVHIPQQLSNKSKSLGLLVHHWPAELTALFLLPCSSCIASLASAAVEPKSLFSHDFSLLCEWTPFKNMSEFLARLKKGHLAL